MVNFAYEPLQYMLKTGLPELAMRCWEETENGFHLSDRFSPDWRTYQQQEEDKNLGFISMREGEVLEGYAVVKINPDIHHAGKRVGLLNDIYIREDKRGHAAAYFHYIEQLVLQMGAQRLDVAQIVAQDGKYDRVAAFYRLIGYRPMEIVWSKILQHEGNA